MATRTPLLDYYDVLGLPKTAGQADIEAAFRSQMLKVRDLPGSGEQTRRIGLAYRALSNPDRRREYDAALTGTPLATGEPAPAPAAAPVPTPPPPLPPHRMEEPAYPEPEAEAAPAAYDEEQYEYEPRRSDRSKLVPALLAAALLLPAGLWAGGAFNSEPRTAEAAPEAGQPSAPAGNAAPEAASEDEGGGLADALASLLPSSREPETEIAQQGPTDAAPVVASSEQRVAVDPPAAEGVATAPATDVAAAVAAVEDSAPAPAPEQPQAEPAPAPEPVQVEARPPPPAIDRSASPRLIAGGLRNSDNEGGRFQGTVGVRLAVGPDGRARGCSVTRSSGSASLDATTCRLLQERLQFTPARDREGNPTTTEVESTHVWGRQRRR